MFDLDNFDQIISILKELKESSNDQKNFGYFITYQMESRSAEVFIEYKDESEKNLIDLVNRLRNNSLLRNHNFSIINLE